MTLALKGSGTLIQNPVTMAQVLGIHALYLQKGKGGVQSVQHSENVREWIGSSF